MLLCKCWTRPLFSGNCHVIRSCCATSILKLRKVIKGTRSNMASPHCCKAPSHKLQRIKQKKSVSCVRCRMVEEEVKPEFWITPYPGREEKNRGTRPEWKCRAGALARRGFQVFSMRSKAFSHSYLFPFVCFYFSFVIFSLSLRFFIE
jgi:hypothetical protein